MVPPRSTVETALPRTWGLGVFCVSEQVRLNREFLTKNEIFGAVSPCISHFESEGLWGLGDK